jgi:uncharacterized protein HemY
MKTGRLLDAATTLEQLVKKNHAGTKLNKRKIGRKNPGNQYKGTDKKESVYTQAMYYLGETYQNIGRPGNAHYYLGCYFMGKGNFGTAKFHLAKALKIIENPEKKREIQKMMKQINKISASQKALKKEGLERGNIADESCYLSEWQKKAFSIKRCRFNKMF